MTDAPKTLREKLERERANYYKLLEQVDEALNALISGAVSSYSIGNRSLTYNNINDLKMYKAEMERMIEEIEATLSGRSIRNVTTNAYLSPSLGFPRSWRK